MGGAAAGAVLPVSGSVCGTGKGLRLEPFRKYLQREGPVKVGFFFSTALLIVLILLGVGPAPLQDPNVGGKVLELASTVMTTIILAGWGVVFILKSGVVEFVSILGGTGNAPPV